MEDVIKIVLCGAKVEDWTGRRDLLYSIMK
jgi:hypothetical protein